MSNQDRNKRLLDKGLISRESIQDLDTELLRKVEKKKEDRQKEMENLLEDLKLVNRLLTS